MSGTCTGQMIYDDDPRETEISNAIEGIKMTHLQNNFLKRAGVCGVIFEGYMTFMMVLCDAGGEK